MPGWDADTVDAIERFANGTITEQEADGLIRAADGRKRAWMLRKGYCRR